MKREAIWRTYRLSRTATWCIDTEIDVALFEAAERGRGYGTLELAREPLAYCAFSVERAHERPPGEEFRCTNRRFADFPDTAPGSLRAFDLRQGLDRA